MEENLKKCIVCEKQLELSNFHKHRREKDGHRSVCKQCRKIVEIRCPIKRKLCRDKLENKLKALEYGKLYRERNKEKTREYAKKQNRIKRNYMNEWQKKKYKTKLKNNPTYRISHSMSGRLLDFFKN